MTSNNQARGADGRRGSAKIDGNASNTPTMNAGVHIPQGMSIMPQAMGMPLNLGPNMGGAFIQNMMGAIGGNVNAPMVNFQQPGQFPQAGHQLLVGGQANQQLQGFMAMNNPNISMANFNANMGLNNMNQSHGQNNQQLQLMNLLAQQQQSGIGPNQHQIEATKGQMQSLMPNQTQHFQQQQLQTNLLKRQQKINAQSNSSSPNRGGNMNADSTSSLVQQMQMPAPQAQTQNMLPNQLRHLQQEVGNSNQRRPSSRSSFVMQSHEPHSDLKAHSGQHRPGSSASNPQQPNHRRPSSRMSVGAMSNTTQTGNQRQSHFVISSHGQHQQHQNTEMEMAQKSQQRIQSQTPINQQSIPSGQLMMPNQFLPQQSQYMMQNMWNQQLDQSNFPSTMLQISQGETQQRRLSKNTQGETQSRRPSNYLSNPSNGAPTQTSAQRQHADDLQVQITPQGNVNHGSKSLGSVHPTDQSSTTQNQQRAHPQQDTSSPPPGETGQHNDQQAQAQAWFLFQQVSFCSCRVKNCGLC